MCEDRVVLFVPLQAGQKLAGGCINAEVVDDEETVKGEKKRVIGKVREREGVKERGEKARVLLSTQW